MLSGGCWGLKQAWTAGEQSQPQRPRAAGRLVHITQPSGFTSLCPGSWVREGRAGEGPRHYSLGWLEGPRGPAERLPWQSERYWGGGGSAKQLAVCSWAGRLPSLSLHLLI